MEEISKQIKQYLKIYRKWENAKSERNNDDYISQMLDIEERVLAYFGLPFASKFLRLFYKLNTDKAKETEEIARFIAEINKTAEKYLLEPVKTDIERIQEGLKSKIDPMDILAEMKIDMTYYHLYVFSLGREGKITSQNILEEFKKIGKHEDLSALLSNL